MDEVVREIWECQRCTAIQLGQSRALAPRAPRHCSWNREDFLLFPSLIETEEIEELEDEALDEAA